jgi:predicted peptidase
MKSLLDSLIRSKVADRKRMYIGGLSLGGFGTFNMIERYPTFFAAAFPICGGGDTQSAGRFAKTTAVWIFHGDKDEAVDVKYSRDYYTALKKANADVRYTEYAGVGHNSWNNAFAEKDLVHWMFMKKKK